MTVPRFRALALLVAPALVAVLIALGLSFSSSTPVSAVAPGTGCNSYSGGVCTITVGSFWFCDASFSGTACRTTVSALETVRWDFGATGTNHSTTECGASCDTPTMTPVFDSHVVLGGTYDFVPPFAVSPLYRYHCTVHPDLMQGEIVVIGGEPPPTFLGDTNCDGLRNAIDAALVLQLGAGLVDSLACQQNADVNEDGHINSIDAALILQFGAGLIGTLPP